jgi:anti-anti-sigma regulatory factor
MLRILFDHTTPDAAVLRLAGQLRDRWVAELRQTCAGLLREGSGASLTLDLSDVTFMDRAGLALCGELASRGVSFVNYSLFTAEQLKGLADVEP